MFTLSDLKARAKDERELVRAQEILDRGKIHQLRVDAQEISAEVQGSGRSTYLAYLQRDLTGRCSCQQWRNHARRFCKHLGALALVWLREDGTSVTAAEADPELYGAVHKLSADEARALLFEAAGRVAAVRKRLLTGDWNLD
jgi:uncharacterized Zn finger protein